MAMAGHDYAPSAREMETGLEQTLWPVEATGRHQRFRAPRPRMGMVWACLGIPHPATEGLATFLSALVRYRDDANQCEVKGEMT